jgi:hypothetical protein
MNEMAVNKNTSGPSSILRTTCESHTLSNNVLLILMCVLIVFLLFSPHLNVG